MTSDADGEDEMDRVETDVVVDCDIEAAWALVSEPGWWVNDGPLGDHEVSLGDDGLYRVSDPDAGDWLIEKACGSRSWSRPRTTSRAAELLSPRAGIC